MRSLLRLETPRPRARTVSQDAREVRTKNAKTFLSKFFPVDPIFETAIAEWVAELNDMGFGPDDPLFPATSVEQGPVMRFVVTGLTREFWKSAAPVRRMFKEAFERAYLPYFNPHSPGTLLQSMARRSAVRPRNGRHIARTSATRVR